MYCAECEKKNCIENKPECVKDRQIFIDKYNNSDDRKLIEKSYNVTSITKAKASRINELIEFSKQMNYNHLGIAFCKGLSKQAKQINDILRSSGFDVTSVCCKTNDIDKSDINVSKINENDLPEVACNPLAQASILNNSGADLTVTVGFCMGHDILFYKNIKTPVSPLIVKDRAHMHNPIKGLD